jgi:GNAT superfamily N-acetyltransferase
MIKMLNIKDQTVAQKILEVQIPSYQVEAELIGFQGIPPLYDTVESLMQCNETFLGYFFTDKLAGFISYVKDGTVLDIHRMAVHPTYFRKGVASSLIAYLLKQESDMEKAVVRTGSKNTPAKNLYRRFGFHEVGDAEVAPGVLLTFLKGLWETRHIRLQKIGGNSLRSETVDKLSKERLLKANVPLTPYKSEADGAEALRLKNYLQLGLCQQSERRPCLRFF